MFNSVRGNAVCISQFSKGFRHNVFGRRENVKCSSISSNSFDNGNSLITEPISKQKIQSKIKGNRNHWLH